MLISIKISRNSAFSCSDKPRMIFFPLINFKMPTIVGILTFMSRKKFMLSRVEHAKSFKTSGPGLLNGSVNRHSPLSCENYIYEVIHKDLQRQ